MDAMRQYQPGLDTLSQRLNTYQNTLARMLDNLTFITVADDKNPLRQLTTRDNDDPTIALLDAWAMCLDVLDFYQQRIINENYLRTAKERRSIKELATAIGYTLNPGVSAASLLAFTIDDSPTSPKVVSIPAKTKVQNIPRKDALPETFETTETLVATAEFNVLQPFHPLTNGVQEFADITSLNLQSIGVGLKAGDSIFLQDGTVEPQLIKLTSVVEDKDNGQTTIFWETAVSGTAFKVYKVAKKTGCFGHNAPRFRSLPIDSVDNNWDGDGNWDGQTWNFGAPKDVEPNIWNSNTLATDSTTELQEYTDADFYLSEEFDGIVADQTWIALFAPSDPDDLLAVKKASGKVTKALADFGLSGRVTGISLEDVDKNIDFKLRDTVVFVQGEELPLAVTPMPDPDSELPIEENNSFYIELDSEISAINNKIVLISGETKNGFGKQVESALVTSDSVNKERLYLAKNTQYSYIPNATKIFANVVNATHGETVVEVLGSGDGTKANQRFRLKRSPLTYIADANSSRGIVSTLEIRINGVLWSEVESLHNQASNSQVYVVQLTEDGQADVIFGDGVRGARLPTGQENIVAAYRIGIGEVGFVDAESLELLQTRPLGVRSVTNPLATAGAQDPEVIDDARSSAPLTVLTMDRIVSLNDYENFVKGFTSVAKANAIELKQQQQPIVHITTAGHNGNVVDNSLLRNAIKDRSSPGGVFELQNYTEIPFYLTAELTIDPRYVFEQVKKEAEAELNDAFSFAKRDLGQDVSQSEIIKLIHDIPGVVAVKIEELNTSNDGSNNNKLTAKLASANPDSTFSPAELLVIAEITLEEWSVA